MLIESEPVRHAGDIVADDDIFVVLLVNFVLIFYGQHAGIFDIDLKKGFNKSSGLIGHPIDAVMVIEFTFKKAP